ncbi:hypothetical protein BX661DRAFT_176597 [Kickxella alabastrina]|uniref:uncharacterized protein n=1 Tax=Kickxella alabastrina TaxID=61397 RepID=UPI0022204E8A|nr:uncharacterized protein BX661DRAFT_176597 [Kickxella alabastrina]KAI7834069.1 hypothetical protein BX661DRAFT_176597 [Kickxella alabastrina]
MPPSRPSAAPHPGTPPASPHHQSPLLSTARVSASFCPPPLLPLPAWCRENCHWWVLMVVLGPGICLVLCLARRVALGMR